MCKFLAPPACRFAKGMVLMENRWVKQVDNCQPRVQNEVLIVVKRFGIRRAVCCVLVIPI